MTNKNVAIKGDCTVETGKRIINYLEGLGGVNDGKKIGFSDCFYYNEDGYIKVDIDLPIGYELITIPEPTPEKTFPREMWVWNRFVLYGRTATVDGMYKNMYVVNIDDDAFEIYLNAKEIDPPKPITTDEKIADLQKQIDELKNMMR